MRYGGSAAVIVPSNSKRILQFGPAPVQCFIKAFGWGLLQNRLFSSSFGSRPRLRLLAMETKLGAGAARKGNRTANPIGIREELL
jgi:hypothetical protein